MKTVSLLLVGLLMPLICSSRAQAGTWGEDSVDYKADVPRGTELRIDVRTAAGKGQLNQAEWQHLEANAFSLHATDRCLQYRATFKSGNSDRFPVLDRVTVNSNTGQ